MNEMLDGIKVGLFRYTTNNYTNYFEFKGVTVNLNKSVLNDVHKIGFVGETMLIYMGSAPPISIDVDNISYFVIGDSTIIGD